MKENLFEWGGWSIYILLTGIFILILFATNNLFVTDGIYYQSFGEKLTTDRITKFIEQSNNWRWLGYISISIIVLMRVGFTATCLYIGLFVAELKARFRDLFKVALLADFVFVLAGIIKLIILILLKEVNTLDDLQFQPLSLMELFDKTSVDVMLIYPLSLLNVFEALYWLTLAWLLTGIMEKPLGSTVKTVATSYGTGLVMWVLFVIFLTVTLS